jgi:hypothetical protein
MNWSIRILLLFLAGITACRKPSNDATRSPDKLRISRIAQSTVREPQKVNVTDFIYDDQQRVQEITYYYEEMVNGGLNTQPKTSITYYYNGTDKKPYKASGQVSNGFYADIFYTYNNAGQLIRDSAKGAGMEVRTHDYTYTPNYILVKTGKYTTISTGGVYGGTFTDSVVIKNNNIAEVVYWTGSIGLPGYYYKFSYDDKINPLSKLNIAAVKIVEGFQIFPDILAPGICKNNMTAYTYGTISYSGGRSDGETQPYIFTYTKEGLPETCTITNRLETYTIKYTYDEF